MISPSEIKKNAVLQYDSSDCGPACLVSIIKCYGGVEPIENIRKLSGTDKSGTTLLGLYQAASKCGFDAMGYEANIDEIKDYKGVIIHHVRLNGCLEHFIVNFGYNKNEFVIWDPSEGLKLLKPEELDKIWVSKKCLGLIRNNEFISKKENSLRIRRWLFEIIRPDINIFLVSIITGILFSSLGLVLAIFTQKLVDYILPEKNFKLLAASLVLVFVLLVARILVGSLRQLLLISQSRDFNIRIVDNFFGTLLSLPKYFFDTRKTGDFVARLNDTIRVQRVITDLISLYVIDVLIVLISVIILFFYSYHIAIFSLIFTPLFFLMVYRWNNRILSGQKGVMVSYAQSESYYIDSILGNTEIKSCGWYEHFRKTNKTIYSEFQQKYFFLGKLKIGLGLLTGIMGSLYIILIIFYSSVSVMNLQKTTGELMAILSVSSGMLPSVLNLALVAIPVNEAKVAISRMFEFTQVQKENSKSSKIEFNSHIESINLSGISFRFPGRKLLLEDINLSLQKGKVTSLVGESGEGKSTLANIILRFYEPEKGTILINNEISYDEIPLELWRARVGYIPQEIHIFNGTILQNLLADLSEEKIIDLFALINKYGFGTFFDSFPSGVMTVVGEEGLKLSGGQKQVIGIFRALARSPEFLIIDEGTSNMDTETERKVTSVIKQLSNNMGILMITHKVNLAKNVSNNIYVLEDGRITGSGNHEKLITENDKYRKFWTDFI